MFDDLFDFDRDRNRGLQGTPKGGLRGFLARLLGDGGHDPDQRPRSADDQEDRASRAYDDGDDDDRDRGVRRHDRDRDSGFFGDD